MKTVAHVAVVAHHEDIKTAHVVVHDQHEASKAKVTHHQASKIHRDKPQCKVSCPVPKVEHTKDLPVCRPATPEHHEDHDDKDDKKSVDHEKKHAPHSESIAELDNSYRRRNGLASSY
jgi:hypothetical protein